MNCSLVLHSLCVNVPTSGILKANLVKLINTGNEMHYINILWTFTEKCTRSTTITAYNLHPPEREKWRRKPQLQERRKYPQEVGVSGLTGGGSGVDGNQDETAWHYKLS